MSTPDHANELPKASEPPIKIVVERTNRRASEVDRRAGLERRTTQKPMTGAERRAAARREGTGLERRRGPGRRREDDRRSAEEGEMNAEQFEFVMAIEAYKKVNHRLYPTWTEVLEVLQQLGYRKIAAREIRLENVPEAPIHKAA